MQGQQNLKLIQNITNLILRTGYFKTDENVRRTVPP